ncbi:RPN2/26s proteasome regulatory subunit [Cryptosporidium felis]|nr:RPN2/26s proteasome regulatory subunit [Cryptosporidium felis]
MTEILRDSATLSGIDKLSSISGYGMLLEDESVELREFALRELNAAVDFHWFEIVDYLESIENCFEDEMFPNREQAALLASKIYFHLEDYDESLRYLLSSYRLFDPMESSSFAESMVVKCIDEFIKICKSNYDCYGAEFGQSSLTQNSHEIEGLDPRLEEIVLDLISRTTSNGQFLNAFGIALEARRDDLLVQILKQSLESIQEGQELSQFYEQCLASIRTLDSVHFQLKSYQILVQIIQERETSPEESPSLRIYSECLCEVGDSDTLLTLLVKLAHSKDNFPKALSLAFSVLNHGKSSFSHDLTQKIDQEIKNRFCRDQDPGEEDPETNTSLKNLNKLKYVLSGKASSELDLQFLHLNNQPDLGLLEHIKNTSDQRSAISHTAIVMSHGLMQAGTTCDVFLRNNLEWLGKATHWSRFSTASSLGVIHMGHLKEAFKVLSTVLPASGGGTETSGGRTGTGSGGGALGGQYSEGGSFFALGLVHANRMDEKARNYLLDKLKNSQRNEVLQHGASLGLGVMGLGSGDSELYEELRNVLYMDNAVAGEAAAYAIGLIMFGSGSKKAVGDLLSYAKDTQHEKIVRACSVALGFVMFGKGQEADDLFLQLNSDGEHFIRYGAMHVLGLAYCGTGNEFALEKLLHACVSELSDDNRRAAVFALGLVMCRNSQQLPQIFSLLCDSYNPHVRYAAALTLGIICCGSDSQKVASLLRSMTTDSSDIVRQAAYIGLGILLMQQNEVQNEKFSSLRQQMIKACTDKHEHIATRFGAILGLGLMDAGGRNVTASLFSRDGEHLNPQGIAGFSLFFQFWFWFPLVHCVSLAFLPTSTVGLDEELRAPGGFSMFCSSEKEKFDYPKPFSLDKSEDKKVVVTAVLSTASKKKKKACKVGVGLDSSVLDSSKQEDIERETKMQVETTEEGEKVVVEGPDSSSISSSGDNSGSNRDGNLENETEMQVDNEKAKKGFSLKNPFRVLKSQVESLEFVPNSRYSPVFLTQKSGFILLKDNTPTEPEEYIFSASREDKEEQAKTAKQEGQKHEEQKEQKKQGSDDDKMHDNGANREEEMVPPETFEWQG